MIVPPAGHGYVRSSRRRRGRGRAPTRSDDDRRNVSRSSHPEQADRRIEEGRQAVLAAARTHGEAAAEAVPRTPEVDPDEFEFRLPGMPHEHTPYTPPQETLAHNIVHPLGLK